VTVTWDLIDDSIEQRLGSLGKRAKKRSGIQVTATTFRVFGDPKLSDAYDTYEVELEGHQYHCSCQDHGYGEYRKMCSHSAYVVLARRGIVPWAASDSPEESTPTPAFQDLPAAPLPLFVDQGQEWTEGVREALDQHFGSRPSLPPWIRFIRPHQWDAYTQVLSLLDAGTKVVFLSAPTGSGKTLIAEMVRRSLNKKAAYVCTTKTLQNQVAHDFDYAKVIKGRANYKTLNYPETDWLACDLCERKRQDDSCRYCSDPQACPYQVARMDARDSNFAVANTAYLLAEGNGEKSIMAGRPFLIVDEADALEDELMRHIEIGLSPRLMKQLGIKPPDKKTVTTSWQEWLDRVAIPVIGTKVKALANATEPRDVRHRRHLSRLYDQMDGLHFDDEWIYTGYDAGWVKFKPVKVTEQAPKYLWHLAKQWLLMSATIISAQQMAEDLGLDDNEWAFVEVPSVFPVENRPLYVEPVANMTAKTKETAWPAALKRIKEIASWHDERILVHTVSYALAEFLAGSLAPRAITYRSAKDREQALEDFLASDNGILLAPSFERGIDLPYDTCRVVIVAKVPFPNLADKQVKKRLYSRGGQGWYAMQTVRALIQMTGRAMRHEDDTAEVYIIDRQFVDNIWKKKKHLLPKWWTDALVMGGSANLAAVRRGEVKV
jgi:Rad3-related DNA helicase